MADYAVGYDDIQRVTIRFHRPVDSDIVNDRFRDIRELGIYTGGRISKPEVGKVSLSSLVCEIRGGDHQVRVQTSESITNIPLDDGKYLVLQWAYKDVEDTDFMVIDQVLKPGDDDIVVGQRVGSTISYIGRTTPDTHHLFLRVEADEPASNSVWIRAGVGHDGLTYNRIHDRKIPLSGYEEDDKIYIYVNDSGAVVPSEPGDTSSYIGKALLAKITMPANGKPENDDIEDVRSFVTPPGIPDNSTIGRNSSGELQVKDLGITTGKLANLGVTLAKIASVLYANNLATNGYQKIFGGLVLMWGVQAGTRDHTYTIHLPVPLTALVYANASATSVEGTQNATFTHTYTSSSFKIWSGDNGPYHWFAIGY